MSGKWPPTLNKLITGLTAEGCFPGIYRRGKLYRAHVNISGNYWADEPTPFKAMKEAIKLWTDAGKPMDGNAAT
jgi:hypothetical protein